MAARLTTFVVVAIVAVTLIAGLIVGAQRDDSDGPVDLIVHNARIYTANSEGAMAEAVAIRGNQILRVGSDREIARLKRPQTTTIDAKGATVLPGFNDAHLDFINGGAGLDRIDLIDAATPDDLERLIRDWADANPDRPWVLGRGWHRELFTDGPPTRQLLNRLVQDRPAALLSADGLTAWVNSKALRLARITSTTRSPAHGAIVHDSRTGEPNGLLQGSAVALVERLVPTPTGPERDRALRAAIAEANRFGITSVQDATGSLDALAAYAEARRVGDLRVRVYSALPVTSDLPDADLDRLEAATAKYPDNPLLKGGALSLTLEDGGAPEAALAESAAEALHFEPDVLNRLVRRLDARGYQISTAASGDRAVAMALNAYQHAMRSNPTRSGARRHRIQNLAALADDDLPRLASLDILASMRPAGSLLAGAGIEAGGPADLASLARRVAAARGRLAFGSGWPAAALNPLVGLGVLVTRAADGDDNDGSRLSLKAAIDGYTSGAAWASFDEQRKGTIAAGMLADIVLLSDDIFALPASRLAETRVEVTVFDGKVVYRRGQRTTN